MTRLGFALALALAPVVALAQAVAPSPDDAAWFAKLLLDAVRGGDWMLASLAGLILVVWVVRKVLVKLPKVGAFLATDAGGVLVNLGTIVPLALLGAKMAGQPLSLGLVVNAVGGATALYVMAKKLARPLAPLAYRIPYVGPAVASLLDPLYVPPLKVVG